MIKSHFKKIINVNDLQDKELKQTAEAPESKIGLILTSKLLWKTTMPMIGKKLNLHFVKNILNI